MGHALSMRLDGESTALKARGWSILPPALERFTKPIGQLMIVVLLAIMTAIRCACVSTCRSSRIAGRTRSRTRPLAESDLTQSCRPSASQPAATTIGLIFVGALSAFFDQDR
jgi:hypothetical protein